MSRRKRLKRNEDEYVSAKDVIEKSGRGGGRRNEAFKLPKKIPLFKFTEAKTYELDHIPWHAGKGNPGADKGKLTYVRDYFVHTGLGPDGKTYACPNQNWGKRCPQCEYAAKMKKKGWETKKLQPMWPKRRQLYLVRDRQNKKAGLQLMECAFFGKGQGYGEMIANKMKAAKSGSQKTKFFHLKGGMTLMVTTEKSKFAGNVFYRPIDLDMEARKKDLNPDLLVEADKVDVDGLPTLVDYEELMEKLLGGSGEEAAKGSKKKDKKKGGKKAKDEDEDEDEDDEEDEDEDDEEDEDEDEDEDEESDDEDEDEDEDEDSDDEDDEEDEDEDEYIPKKKDAVVFTFKKKKYKGTVDAVDKKKETASVKVKGEKKPFKVNFEDLKKSKK